MDQFIETDNLVQLYHIDSHKILTKAQAEQVIQLLNSITEKAIEESEAHVKEVKKLAKDSRESKLARKQIIKIVKRWSDHAKRIGANPISLYKCKIYTTEKVFHWEYPQRTLH
jgi:small-conductance mechanosensitive channel